MSEPLPTVFLIDSDPRARETFASLLRRESHRVQTAGTLAEAAPLLQGNQVDVLLVELRSGDDVLTEARSLAPGAACVVLAATATVSSAVAALRRGAYDYLVKPCMVEDLKQTVGRAVAHIRANRLAASQEQELRQLNEQLEERVRARTSELAEAMTRLEEANAAKDRFLATLSHELRTPLTPLQAALDLLRLRDEASLTPVVEAMESSLAQATRLISDLLDMARVTAGKLTLERQAVDLTACLRGAVDAVRPRASQKQQTLALSLASEFPTLLADPVRLRQVVTNLLDNAVKFSPEGGKIVLTAHREGAQAVISVSDTGPGIDPAFLPYIFEPFRQADSSSRRQHGGLGLGLSVARQIVQLHGGTLEAANRKPGPGAVLTFSLAIIPTQPRPAVEDPVSLGRLRVLLVDDSADTVAVLSRLLAARGLEVRTALRVAPALELAREDPPDVVITDIGMPDQDGYDLLRLLREDEQLCRIPVVAATGYVGSSEQAHMTQMGFAATLPKPFDLDELLRTLDRVRPREGEGG